MSRDGASFDRLARWYRAIEFAAFGGDLERARFAFLGRLAPCREILLLGEGDGRCAARLAALAPAARILCVDSSPRMLERAKRRLASTADAGRVGFTCADLRSFVPEAGKFDAVATFFVLDCFGPDEVAAIVARASAALRPGAQWLFADFVLPPRGFARARARAWLALLYAFFRWETGLRVSALTPSEEILQRAGWFPLDSCDYQGGMVRSAVLIAPGERPGRLR
jgi:SAM-dependent methyltransferase